MNCTLEFLADGKVARLTHENGRIIFEILIHGPLIRVAQNCDNRVPIANGRPNIFRGELYGLAGYEILDVETGCIIEKQLQEYKR